MQNPYGGLPPNAVAGPGGGDPGDMAAINSALAAQSAPRQGGGLTLPSVSPSTGGESTAVRDPVTGNEFIKRAPVVGAGGFVLDPSVANKPGLSAPDQPSATEEKRGAPGLKLLPTVAEAQQAANAPAGDPLAQKAAEWQMRHDLAAGRGGPRTLAETGETQKYNQYGAVPEPLQQDIASRQDALDKSQTGLIQQQYADQGEALKQQRAQLEQQQRDAQAAAVQRQAVDQRISQLQAHSDAQEAALVQAKPKQVNEFWGGNMAAQMVGALAIALGAGVQARTGQPNPGAAVVNGAIDRWVNDQKQQYEAAKDQANLADNRYKQAIEIYGTPEAASASLRLQALTATNAMAQNMAEQSKNQQWLTSAQLMQQSNALDRQKLKAQAIQQAGMKEVESKLTVRGGPGSGSNKNPYEAAATAYANTHKAVREGSDTSNEDIKTGIEAAKEQGKGLGLAQKAQSAADAAARFRDKASSFGGRTPGQGKGELEAARVDAETKYAAYLAASGGASTRNALQVAQDFFKGKGDAIRGPSADPALDAHIKTLRGNAVRAAASHAGGVAPESGEVGEPE